MTDQKKLLQIDSVTKVFPGVRALGKVTFSVLAGEVHGLIGENGAGKSTLMAVAAGALVPEEGRIVIDGIEAMGDTERARFLGLAIVRQEPALMPDLTLAENLYLGVPEAERPSLMDLSAWVRRLLEQWSDDVAIDSGARVLSLNPERRFIVEIVKAVAAKPKVLVLDEPTEHLLAEDVERLFERIRNITASGCAVVYISHRIREVRKIANRLTVLRDGPGQGTYEAAGLSEQQIVELIVGRAVDSEFPPKSTETASDIVFKVDSLNGTRFANISLELRKGEIVGLAGIDGNGQREFMRALAGLVNSRGRATLNERPLSLRNSRICARAGIVFLPEDRHSEGIFAGLSVRENLSIRSLGRDSIHGLVNPRSETRRSQRTVREYAVKTPSIETDIASLSGGNQQKLAMASVLFIGYVSCSLLAAAGAIPLMAQVGTGDANTGGNYTLASIAAAVIGGVSLFGGRGSFVGCLLGALLLTQINIVTTFLDLDDSWQSFLLGAMILASVTLYSTSRQMVVAK